MARVNVAEGLWAEFRVLAIRDRRTVADYLGELVTKELARASRRQAAEPAPGPPEEGGLPASAPPASSPPQPPPPARTPRADELPLDLPPPSR